MKKNRFQEELKLAMYSMLVGSIFSALLLAVPAYASESTLIDALQGVGQLAFKGLGLAVFIYGAFAMLNSAVTSGQINVGLGITLMAVGLLIYSFSDTVGSALWGTTSLKTQLITELNNKKIQIAGALGVGSALTYGATRIEQLQNSPVVQGAISLGIGLVVGLIVYKGIDWLYTYLGEGGGVSNDFLN